MSDERGDSATFGSPSRESSEPVIPDDEFQQLLQFLYLCPVGLLEFHSDGTVIHLNPEAVNLLSRTLEATQFDNIYVTLEQQWPGLAVLVQATEVRPGRLLSDYRIAAGTSAGVGMVSLSLVCVAADRFMLSVVDVSRTGVVEESLRRSGSLLSVIIHAAPVGLALFDQDFRCLEMNPALAIMSEVAVEDSIGRIGIECLPKLWPALHGLVVRGLVDPVIGLEIAAESSTTVGELRYLLTSCYPVSLVDGGSGAALVVVDITQRKTEQLAVEEREGELQSLFSAIDEGFCVCEMVTDATGYPVDYRFLSVNPLFGEMTGLVDAGGRTALELVPDLERIWIDTYAQVALGGQTLRFEQGSDAMGRWFDVFATPIGRRGRFAIVFKDQTSKRLADHALQRAASVNTFRAELSDSLRTLSDALEIQARAVGLVGRHLQAMRVHFAEFDLAVDFGEVHNDYREAGETTVAGRYRLNDYGSELMGYLRVGRPLVVHDVATDDRLDDPRRANVAALGVGAYVMLPIMSDGRAVAALTVHHRVAHRWSDDELALLDEVAQRTWSAVERARSDATLRRRHASAEMVANLLAAVELQSSLEAQAQCVTDALVEWFADYAVVELNAESERAIGFAVADPSHKEPLQTWRRARAHDRQSEDTVERAEVDAKHARLRAKSAVLRQFRADTATRGAATTFEPRSQVVVSLDLGRGMHATLTVGIAVADRMRFDEIDRTFLTDTADRVAVVLAATRLRRDEHAISTRLQQALLPDALVWHRDLELAARYHAASDVMEVGGDWYDTFLWPTGQIGLVVGDVLGHSLESAAIMGRLRSGLAAMAPGLPPSPAAVLEALQRCARGSGGTDFVTCACVVLDVSRRSLSYASAGHPPSMKVSPDGTVRMLDLAQTPPLGRLENTSWPEVELPLDSGDLVVMYSDGLIERRGQSIDSGLNRLIEIVTNLQRQPVDEIATATLQTLAAEYPPEDDVVMICAKFTPPVAVYRREFPALATELSPLRSELLAWMALHGISADSHADVVLAVNEGCTNAIEHAYHHDAENPAVTVEVSVHAARIIVKITDHGKWKLPVRQTERGPNLRGRGVQTMRKLASDFASVTGASGTEIRMGFQLPLNNSDRRADSQPSG